MQRTLLHERVRAGREIEGILLTTEVGEAADLVRNRIELLADETLLHLLYQMGSEENPGWWKLGTSAFSSFEAGCGRRCRAIGVTRGAASVGRSTVTCHPAACRVTSSDG